MFHIIHKLIVVFVNRTQQAFRVPLVEKDNPKVGHRINTLFHRLLTMVAQLLLVLMPLGLRLPTPQWIGDTHLPEGRPAQRPRLDQRNTNEANTIDEGELLRVRWPGDAAPENFGPPQSVHCFTRLQEEAKSLGMLFKMRHGRSRRSTSSSRSELPSPNTGDYFVQLAGPLGTTREFYEDIRKIMACRRKSWAGLLHPRKVTVRMVIDRRVQEDMIATGSTAAASVTSQMDACDDAGDDTDEGEPPSDSSLSFLKVTQLPTGKRLDISKKDIQKTQSVEFPCQGAEHDKETAKAFHILLDSAREYLEACMMPRVRGNIC